MSLIDLYIRDKTNGKIHRIGDNRHDMIMIGTDGQLHYHNLQNGDGCRLGGTGGGYEFVINCDDCGYNCDPTKEGE